MLILLFFNYIHGKAPSLFASLQMEWGFLCCKKYVSFLKGELLSSTNLGLQSFKKGKFA